MDPTQLIALAIFLVAIIIVITGVIDRSAGAAAGALAMVLVGIWDAGDAFKSVDWNVIVLLISVWLLASYFNLTGVPEWLAVASLKASGGRPTVFLILLCLMAGYVSTILDNVVVILIMAPVILRVTRPLGLRAVPFLLLVGLSANLMGTALIIGDLPPQLLHSVAGAEFFDFIWQFGRPSSFPILTVAFISTLAFFYVRMKSRLGLPVGVGAGSAEPIDATIVNKPFAWIVCGAFALTIIGMAARQVFNFELGFIAAVGAFTLIVVLEAFRSRLHPPDFEKILQELDWRAILFYVALFALVGGLEHTHIIKIVADFLAPIMASNLLIGSTLLFWMTLPIVAVVEHDAYILTFLYVIRDLGDQVNPWPLYWMLLWSGTLGSNLTVAGAPALYVALNLAEAESGKISLREFLSYSAPFVL
ncbi:MAG: permease, partial [Chloroflexi bacterium]|nr:permease [Chloroflexota bacterium]